MVNMFAVKLKELRLEKELTQKDLAEIFYVRPATVSRWEAGLIEPDYSMLIAIAKYFEVTTDYLLGLEN